MEDMLHRPISIEHPRPTLTEIPRDLVNKYKAKRIRRQKRVATAPSTRQCPMAILC